MTRLREKERNVRGFRLFLSDVEQLYGTTSVSESSMAFQGAHCWIFQDRPTDAGGTQGVHLDVAGARKVAEALLTFADEAERGELVEPAEREEDAW